MIQALWRSPGTGLAVLIAAVSPVAEAALPVVDEPLERREAVARSQAVIGQRLQDLELRDRHGRSVNLADYRGKPLVISPVYTSCAHVCRTTTRSLARAVRRARDALGENSFHVITVGFDAPRDDPAAMAAYARRQGVKAHDWDFLSGPPEAVRRFMDAIGFSYWRSPKGYDHLTQTTIVDADGVVLSQVYGQLVDLPQLVEPLKRSVFGADGDNDGVMETVVKRIRYFCTDYDPVTDSYRFDYSLFIGMAIGAGSILGVFGWLAACLRRDRGTAGRNGAAGEDDRC